MYKAALVLCLLALLDTPDCDSDKQNQRITSLESDVKQLKAEVSELKQKPVEHHYELRKEGFRTFRFDPATGDTCIKLTTTDDWKRKETKATSCECVDRRQQWIAMPKNTEDEKAYAHAFYNVTVEPDCGY